MRWKSLVTLAPAPWNTAGLKNATSPAFIGICTLNSWNTSRKSSRSEAMNPACESCEYGSSIVGPDSSGMSVWATAPCSVNACDMRWTWRGKRSISSGA